MFTAEGIARTVYKSRVCLVCLGKIRESSVPRANEVESRGTQPLCAIYICILVQIRTQVAKEPSGLVFKKNSTPDLV